MKHEIISSPLTVVLRKGREHYICEKRLRAYMHFERDVKIYKYLTSLLDERSSIDFAEITGLTAHIKGKIGVSGRCDGNCPYKETCRFLRFLEHSQSDKYDFQVCNHNYLLADTLRRAKDQKPLIPNYQAVIIDEAHKFPQASQQIYGVEL